MDLIQPSGENWPELHNTLLVVAFAGWNDAASSATTAVRLLTEKTDAKPLATIDPEEFFVFTENRPDVSLDESGLRSLSWPSNLFSYVENLPDLNRSLVTLQGLEPDLKWRTFTDTFMEICHRCNVTEVVMLGAMVATVPHTRPVPISGWSTNPVRQPAIEQIGATRSRYEGPTGIVGVLATRFQAEKLDYSSLWAVAPTYLSISPNWKVASRLLSGLNQICELNLNLSEVNTLALRFESHVAEAVARQADVATFVQALEENFDRGIDSDADDDDDDEDEWSEGHREDETELPSADILIQELERQLRQQREGNNDK
jgi:hypothetical protein